MHTFVWNISPLYYAISSLWRSQSERWREDNRGGFKANNFRRDERRDDRRGGGFKRPCKFWMEKGRWEMFWTSLLLIIFLIYGLFGNFQDILIYTRYVSGAKLRIRASTPILADKRLSFLLRSSCWIELRCNIYTSLKQTYQEGLVSTCQESSVLYSDPCASFWWPHENNCDHVVHSDQCEYIVTWTMNYVFPTAPLSIVSYPPNLKVLSSCVCCRRIYMISQDLRSMLMHGMAKRSSSGPWWMGALNWSYWEGWNKAHRQN